jgi:predicted amidohydrolase
VGAGEPDGDVKRDLLVGVAQWLASPGEPTQNLSVALGMAERAAALGVELLVLPELWSCGYVPATLADDARRDAEPLSGPRARRLSEAARRHALFFAAGSVPERGDDGHLYDTALVFDPAGRLVARHRKAHLYPPAIEHAVFTPGDRLTTFTDPALGTVGLLVGFDGDVPEVARALARRGARLVLVPSACEVERSTEWELVHPALALVHGQWWVQANQAGSHGSSTLLGASRIIAPTGTVVTAAGEAVPGLAGPAELVVHRIDLGLAAHGGGLAALLEAGRRPELYTDGPETETGGAQPLGSVVPSTMPASP